jgi:hypothetical protein
MWMKYENKSQANGGDDMDWIHMVQDRNRGWAFANTITNIRVSLKQGDC